MRLVSLPVNRSWGFVFGDALVTTVEGTLFATREDALYAARSMGLAVSPDGAVSAA